MRSGPSVVLAALAGNLAIAVIKGGAAALTGSSAMLSEAIHSAVDTGNELLLLYGMRRAGQSPDHTHPFGYGRELYFWSFIVALLVFAVGAGVSIYQGIAHISRPEPIDRPLVAYAVLALSLLCEGWSWRIALRSFIDGKGGKGIWQAIRHSKDPPQFMVLLEDSAAILGICFAFVGTLTAQLSGDPRWDGAASLGIGALLAVVAAVLARECKGLLIGEQADPAVAREIIRIANGLPGIAHVNGVLTTQLSPTDVIAAVSLEFTGGQDVTVIERTVAHLERLVHRARPEITVLFVKPQRLAAYRRAKTRMLSR